ncbi:MAG: BolA family transcriptional regulator [Betaproteobacteria bacterium]|jgi:BolA family transcriptional regulator, general stress-responsive regulator|nr:BolA family transcriptional regulator [Betaproteobacteria bacterium]
MTKPSTLQNNVPWQPLIERVLQQHFQPSFLEVIDESAQHAGHSGATESGMNSHFRVRIASSHFENISRVQRHRLVYDSLQEFLDNGLHALAIEFR